MSSRLKFQKNGAIDVERTGMIARQVLLEFLSGKSNRQRIVAESELGNSSAPRDVKSEPRDLFQHHTTRFSNGALKHRLRTRLKLRDFDVKYFGIELIQIPMEGSTRAVN